MFAMNQLKTIDVSNNTALMVLACDGNQFTNSTIDVSKNLSLMMFYCSQNNFTTLDISNNTNLVGLNCTDNQLTTLDISNNPHLLYLRCYDNQLETIKLIENAFSTLEELYCHNNKLKTLNTKSCQLLNYFTCQENHLLFSSLPVQIPAMIYHYYPQLPHDGGEVNFLSIIDLSAEYVIEPNVYPPNQFYTKFSWFDITNGYEQPLELIEEENGRFMLTKNLIGKRLRCEMTNEFYLDPLLICIYEINVIGDKQNQKIIWEQELNAVETDSAITLTAYATSNLPVSYTSSDLTVATIFGNLLTIHGKGTSIITAKQD
jgi:hypothetical protein